MCEGLSKVYDVMREFGSQRDYNGNRVVHVGDMQNNGPARRVLCDLADLSRGLVSKWYGEEHLVESVFLGRLGEGDRIEPHFDNTRLDGKIPNHTSQRSHSSLFYLSEDFEGGEIVFPKQGLSVKPETGMYVSFPASPPYLHYVTPVRRGARYSTTVWFTQQEGSRLKARV